MENRKFTQWGYVMIVFPLVIICIFWFNRDVYLSDEMISASQLPLSRNIISFFLFGPALIIIALFYKLTITITDTTLSFSMGIGIISRHYQFKDISQCTGVTNNLLSGWGIRRLRNAWLYNISGNNAIELQFKNKKTAIRIGTNKANEIVALVNQRIQMNGSEI